MSLTDQSETRQAGLPAVLAAPAERPSLVRTAPNAAFLSQLIAARERLMPQRARRSGTAAQASGVYASGSRLAERRMPQGYRKSLLV